MRLATRDLIDDSPPDKRTPAGAEAAGERNVDSWALSNNPENSPSGFDAQGRRRALWLSRCFHLAPAHAGVVAALCFGEAAS